MKTLTCEARFSLQQFVHHSFLHRLEGAIGRSEHGQLARLSQLLVQADVAHHWKERLAARVTMTLVESDFLLALLMSMGIFLTFLIACVQQSLCVRGFSVLRRTCLERAEVGSGGDDVR